MIATTSCRDRGSEDTVVPRIALVTEAREFSGS